MKLFLAWHSYDTSTYDVSHRKQKFASYFITSSTLDESLLLAQSDLRVPFTTHPLTSAQGSILHG